MLFAGASHWPLAGCGLVFALALVAAGYARAGLGAAGRSTG